MCGIVALIEGAPSSAGFEAVPAMLARMMHRGDQPATWKIHGRSALGCVRLAIVDVEHGGQPMEAGDLAIVFNGELYNHVALREELEALGHQFRTECDTEVLLRGYLAWGEGVLDQIEGMYAFVVIDRSDGAFFAARDGYGVKPLYYARTESQWVFASELRPLVEAGFTQIEETPPGGFVRNGQVSDRLRFWQLRPVSQREMPLASAIEKFRREFARSVERRIPTGDLPVAVFCSGGIDSSAVLFEAVETCRRRGVALRDKICVFSVGTADSEDPRFARDLAKDLGVPFKFVEIDVPSMVQSIPETIRAIESFEPNHIRAGTTSMALARNVAAEGFKVALLGEGADELLGGYEEFPQAARSGGNAIVETMLGVFSRQLYLTQLKRVDRTTMAFGIEGRVPFLDDRLARLIASMPTAYKVRKNEKGRYVGKYVLREAYRGDLPDHIVDRRKVPMGEGAGVGDNRPIGAFHVNAQELISDFAYRRCLEEFSPFDLKSKEDVEYFEIFRETFGPLGLAANRPMTNSLKTV